MDDLYDNRGRCLEPQHDYSEGDGANPAQASDHGQDASTHQYPCYGSQEPTQQPTQQLIKSLVRDWYADEHFRESDEDSYDYSQKDPYSDSDEDLVQHSDEQDDVSDEHSCRYPERNPYSDSEDMEEDSDDYPVNDTTMPDAFQRRSENSRLHTHQVPDAHPTQGGYPAAGAASGTENLKSPNFTSWDAIPGRSPPYATSQTPGTWARTRGLPALPDLVPKPFRSVERPVTGFERHATRHESDFSAEEEWDVRMGVAQGAHLEEILDCVDRTARSVQRFIASNGLMWTREQDKQLMESANERHNISVVQELLSHLGGPIRSDDEVQARVQYLRGRAGPAQRAELAGTPEPDPQQYPAGWQPGESVSPQASHEDASEVESTPNQSPWTVVEIEKLERWRAQHPDQWVGVEKEIHGRSKAAIRAKWYDLNTRGSLDQPPRELSSADRTFLKNELAKGIRISRVLAKLNPGYNARSVSQALRDEGWSSWTREEDQQMLDLQQQEGEEWVQIPRKPGRAPRSRQEIQNRYEYLRRVQSKEQQRTVKAGPYRWTPDDDKELGLKLARGMGFIDLERQGFRGLNAYALGRRAKKLTAKWTEQDDRKLWRMDLKPDAFFDWDSVGRQYDPGREGCLVKARWEFLQRRSRGTMLMDTEN